ncbi:sulfatase-like hydrolase/transferase [Pontibacter harenae]|uniref:sulfatase-like hydrolase/transferase n=1 Tax=Pontibacter harenae TaxID=2894083 RepID=UPI001E395CB8|nr:sulfatase-like hydrolase/transferase [Pontibacter harenae]MCC9165915.1 sulfatase-like hydrolase/transferase [Pontibacter harenae]
MRAPSTLYRTTILYIFLCLFVVTVEMRPGRVYYLLQMLLFRNSVANLALYLIIFGLTVWGLQIVLFNKNKTIRIASAAVWLPLLFISLVYRFITGYNYTYADAHTAINNTHLLSEAFNNYTLPLVFALAGTIATGAALCFANKRIKHVYKTGYTLVLLPLIVLSYWYINRSLGVIDDLPVFYRVPLSTILAYNHTLPNTSRTPVQISPEQAGVKHLFLIVDESITGGALSINGNNSNTTPFLKSVSDQLQNFGIASAYTNYSAGSNIALMSGLRSQELPDKEKQALKKSNIFQYAKQAGYTTYFIDAQIGRGMLQNFVSSQDLKSIDHFVQVTEEQLEQPYYKRDFVIADLLLKLSKSNNKIFVYVNKAGAHWPYARTYHPDSVFFSPVLSERSMLKDKEKSINAYYNSIRWTVDGFWRKLIHNIQPQDSTFIVYTSDHGQDLSGDGISITHASTINTLPIEANVPLWILDKTGYAQSFTVPSPNQQSHAQIFPTLLLLQGYNEKYIKNNYGPTLYDTNLPKIRYFLSGDIFGRGPSTLIEFKLE